MIARTRSQKRNELADSGWAVFDFAEINSNLMLLLKAIVLRVASPR